MLELSHTNHAVTYVQYETCFQSGTLSNVPKTFPSLQYESMSQKNTFSLFIESHFLLTKSLWQAIKGEGKEERAPSAILPSLRQAEPLQTLGRSQLQYLL